MSESNKRAVILFREQLLTPSETFIRAQGEALSGYTPYYFGLRRIAGLGLPSQRTFILSDGSFAGHLQEVLFKVCGYSPKLQRQLVSIQPRLVHAHFGFDGTTILSLVRRMHIPLVVTYHGFDATTRPEHMLQSRLGRRYLVRRDMLKQHCTQFIAVSQFIRGKLVEQSFPEKKITVHYIGIDTDMFTPSPSVHREPIVLFVGRLVEKKGCEFLIRAMRSVQEWIPQVELVIVGDGPLRASLERQAAETLCRYSFLGLQTPEQIHIWMNRATVLCAPSITAQSGDAEGLPMVVVEALSMGLPVAAFSSAGIPEAVADGETGLLAPERDWRSLAANIAKLLTDGAAWESMSRAGQQRVRRDFNLRRQCEKLEQIYDEIRSRYRIEGSI